MSKSDAHPGNHLTDLRGRILSYLRISLTEKCNLRCGYCYRSVEDSQTPGSELSSDLSNHEVLRLVRVFSKLGFDKIRFTGGELLLRDRVVDLVRETAATPGISLIAITTNGLLLEKYLSALVDAGLTRLNVSLDTLDREKFRRITGVDGFERVRNAILRAEEMGVFPRVKVNTVIIRGMNDDEIERLAEWALSRRIDLRFIEFMPTRESGWDESRFVGEDEMIKRINLPLEIEPAADVNAGPAVTFKQPGRPGRISFISAVSRSFCNQCNRLRVTSKGNIVGCLFGGNGVNIRELLEPHISDEKIVTVLKNLITSHEFKRRAGERSVTSEGPSMRGIGG